MDPKSSLPQFLHDLSPEFLRGFFSALLGVLLFISGCTCGSMDSSMRYQRTIRALEQRLQPLKK